MTADATIAEPAHASGSKTSFFLQSSWMVIATIVSGACMFAVHFFSQKIPKSEYNVLVTLLTILHWMGIPTVGLQMVFAQQTAAAVTDEQHRQVTGTIRAIWFGTTIIWLLAVLVVIVGHDRILTTLKIRNSAGLWVTLLVGLGSLWAPIFTGVLQGQQKFLWLGWSSIFAGAGRLLSVAVIVLFLGGYAAGMMTGAAIGLAASLVVVLWHTRDMWLGPSAAFNAKGWLKRVIPLSLGFGASQFMFSADPIFVQTYFQDASPYMPAGVLARALILFTSPLAAVMFPKVVRSVARSEKSDVMLIALATTGILVGTAALGLALVGPWVLRIVFGNQYSAAGALLPWFAFAMVPLALANILVNNLMARERFVAVPCLVVVAVLYAVALMLFHRSFLMVIGVLALANIIYLAVAAWFTWHGAKQDIHNQPTFA